MRSVVVLVVAFSVSSIAAAQPKDAGVKPAPADAATPVAAPEWVDGKWVYVHNGVQPRKDSDTPEAACKLWPPYNNPKMSVKDSFVKTKPGTTDLKMTCVFNRKDSKPPQWDQTDLVDIVLRCPAGSSPRSSDNSGKRSTIRCHCDSCVVPPPQNYCDPKSVPKHAPSNPGDADLQSWAQLNQLSTQPDMIAAYNDAKAKIDYSKDDCPFHEFSDDELCESQPNDINIGQLCGSRDKDFAAANALAGFDKTPAKCTWHHHDEIGRMQLVKKSVHAGTGHSGSVAIWKKAFCTDADGKPIAGAQCDGYNKEKKSSCSTASSKAATPKPKAATKK